MQKSLDWRVLTDDLSLRFRLPACYREGLESYNTIALMRSEAKDLRYVSSIENKWLEGFRDIYYDKNNDESSITVKYNGWLYKRYYRVSGVNFHDLFRETDRWSGKKFTTHQYGRKWMSENYIDRHHREFAKDKVEKHLQLDKIKVIQYKDGKTYVFLDKETIEYPHEAKNLIEWWLIKDNHIILRYSKWILIKTLSFWTANDVFIVIDRKEWKVLWSFEGSLISNKYIEFEGELLPCFDKPAKIKEIETSDNEILFKTLLLTEQTERTEIIGKANSTIEELTIQKNSILPGLTNTIPLYIIEKTLELLISCDQIPEEYTILEEQIKQRTKLETIEHESIEALKRIKQETITLIKSDKLRHLSFIAYIREHQNKPWYDILEKEIGNVIM